MNAYSYNDTGRYTGPVECQIDPVRTIRTGRDAYLLPANSTFAEPPEYNAETHEAIWNGSLWEVKEIVIPEPTPPTHEEINQMVVAKIRERYDVNEEFKMINLGITNAEDEQYIAYRTYVAECIAWGDTLEEEQGG